MVVVVTNPTAIDDEASIINNLFNEGLELLHIRKPNSTIEEIKMLLQKIETQNYHSIALHQHHELCFGFGIGRLHFTETHRQKMTDEMLIKLKANNYILSTSIHDVAAYNNLSAAIDYTFFGPVFNSISKTDYGAVVADDFVFPVKKDHCKVVAIAGINAANIKKVKKMQFNGVAVLGSIWQNPSDSILQFKAIQKAWNQTGQ